MSPQHDSAISKATQIKLSAAVQLQCTEHHNTLYLVVTLCKKEAYIQAFACSDCGTCQQVPGLSYSIDEDSSVAILRITWHLR